MTCTYVTHCVSDAIVLVTVIVCVTYMTQCHGSAGTPLGTHAGRKALGLQDARTAIRT
jgi:hypothetical protein